MLNNLNDLYSDSKDDASTKLAQLSQLYQQHSHPLTNGIANNDLQSPNKSINNVSNNSSSSAASSKSNKSSATPNPYTEKLKPKCNCAEMQRTECHLETKELWDKFNELGTEMIITKTGR